MGKKLFGVITAMTTPFDDRDRISADGLKQQTEYLIEKGVQCLYPCGTTGEMYLMDNAERELVAETVVKAEKNRVTVFIHTGAMRTADTIRLSKHACEIGASGVVSGCSGPMPEAFVKVYELFKAGKLSEAQSMQLIATKHVEFLKYGGNMSIFKTILNHRGIYAGHMRKPLMDIDTDHAAEAVRTFETLRAEFPFAEAAGNVTNHT